MEVVKRGPYNQICDLERQLWQEQGLEGAALYRKRSVGGLCQSVINGKAPARGNGHGRGKKKEELGMMP